MVSMTLESKPGRVGWMGCEGASAIAGRWIVWERRRAVSVLSVGG